MAPTMRPVQSSSVALIGYDEPAEELHVRFHDSDVTYVYFDVPPIVFENLERAPSKGTFVNTVVKPRYPCHRL